jgi:hypothetical protein
MERERIHSAEFEPIDTIVSARNVVVPTLPPIAIYYLVEKECCITEGDNGITVTFPPGTTEQRIWPSSDETRYRIMLPTHAELRITRDRYDVVRGLYLVGVGRKEVNELMKRYQEKG